MILLLLSSILKIYIILAQENDCENDTFLCESYLRQSDCPFNQFLEIDKSSGCCPTCRGGLGNCCCYMNEFNKKNRNA